MKRFFMNRLLKVVLLLWILRGEHIITCDHGFVYYGKDYKRLLEAEKEEGGRE